MKMTLLLATASLAAFSAAPASAQLLGGGGLTGSRGGAVGGVTGGLGGALGATGGIDRSVDLNNGRVGLGGSGRANGSGNAGVSHAGRSHRASGSASGSVSGSLTADTLGTNDVKGAVGGARDTAFGAAGAAQDRAAGAVSATRNRAANTVAATRDRANGAATATRDRAGNAAAHGHAVAAGALNGATGAVDRTTAVDASGQLSGAASGAASSTPSGQAGD
jgi:hypothetical protein